MYVWNCWSVIEILRVAISTANLLKRAIVVWKSHAVFPSIRNATRIICSSHIFHDRLITYCEFEASLRPSETPQLRTKNMSTCPIQFRAIAQNLSAFSVMRRMRILFSRMSTKTKRDDRNASSRCFDQEKRNPERLDIFSWR